MRRLGWLVLLFGACWLSGCGSERDDARALCFAFQGTPPASFQVTFSAGSEVASAFCQGESTSGAVHCRMNGAAFHTSADKVTVVIKARFFATQELTLAEHTDGTCTPVTLTALPAFTQQSGDYATGFAEDAAAVGAFTAMAVATGTGEEAALSLKFYIDDIQGTPAVYFMDTVHHPLHYDFVRHVLNRVVTQEQYEQETYSGTNRRAMAGTLILHPSLNAHSDSLALDLAAPITIEFFPNDDLTPAQALQAYRLVEERLGVAPLDGATHRLAYLPAGDGFESQLLAAKSEFAAQSALWLTRTELNGQLSEQLLNSGVAFGTLRAFKAEDLATAVVSYKDILLLTSMPIDLPLVGGTITEDLQTPLSHVNVAARARRTPNLALKHAATDARVQPFLGKLVRFEVTAESFSLREATETEAEAYWASLKPEQPVIPTSDLSDQGLPDFSTLTFADSVKIGVKAANLAEMHNTIPGHAPDGFAIPFYYYDQFMNRPLSPASLCTKAQTDCASEGRTADLCARVAAFCDASAEQAVTLRGHAERLLADGTFLSDTAYREAALDGLRYLIRHVKVDSAFAQALDTKVSRVFGSAAIRMRSSTNSEDLPNFTGAGLYSSYSAGGTDHDAPSDVVRKVWASVWNWQAFEEREYWGIRHEAVYMGVAVHAAFGTEAANGVIITRNLADPALEGYYVNVQLGEDSITNPVSGKMPEIFSIVSGADGMEVMRQRYSDLSPQAPILSAEQIRTLYDLVTTVRRHFAPLYHKTTDSLVLDIEFKLDATTHDIVLKQVRPYAE